MKTKYGKIKKKFYHHEADEPPLAFNVGELISLLKELPKELPIETMSNRETLSFSVYNVKSDPVLIFGGW